MGGGAEGETEIMKSFANEDQYKQKGVYLDQQRFTLKKTFNILIRN